MPDGAVKLSHWWAVFLQEENKGIKSAFTLKRDHLEPTHYQKMKVRLGMQVSRQQRGVNVHINLDRMIYKKNHSTSSSLEGDLQMPWSTIKTWVYLHCKMLPLQ